MLPAYRIFAFAVALFLAAPATATTILYSGTIDESDGRNAPAGGADYVFKDFNTNVANPGLNVGGDLAIYGFVAHKSGSTSKWTDGWTLDFGGDNYQLDFDWARVTSVFDGSLDVGGTTYTLGNVANGSLDLGVLSGPITFHLDPTVGGYAGGERGTWVLTATKIVPTPLPAGGVLLIGGLGTLVVARRKTKPKK